MAWHFITDLEFFIPEHKLRDLKAKLQRLKDAQHVPARQLASAIGKIISMSLALGPVARLMTCSLYATLNRRTAWC